MKIININNKHFKAKIKLNNIVLLYGNKKTLVDAFRNVHNLDICLLHRMSIQSFEERVALSIKEKEILYITSSCIDSFPEIYVRTFIDMIHQGYLEDAKIIIQTNNSSFMDIVDNKCVYVETMNRTNKLINLKVEYNENKDQIPTRNVYLCACLLGSQDETLYHEFIENEKLIDLHYIRKRINSYE